MANYTEKDYNINLLLCDWAGPCASYFLIHRRLQIQVLPPELSNMLPFGSKMNKQNYIHNTYICVSEKNI